MSGPIVLRSAGADDAAGIAAVHHEASRQGLAEVLPESAVNEFTIEKRRALWTGLFADWSRQIALDKEIVAMTRGVVDAGVVDPDHSVNNIVVDEQRQLFRVDLEMAGRHRRGKFFSTRYAMMLGRLIESYTYAVQPHVELSLAFCDRLARELRPSRVARSRRQRRVRSH